MKLPSSPEFGIRFALFVSLGLAIIKGIIGLISGSLAILASALDSLLDMLVSGMNALALKISGKGSTEKYAYGFGKVQGFAAIIESLIVLSTGTWLAYSGVTSYLEHRTPEVGYLEIVVMSIAIMGTSLIMWNFYRIARIQDSLIIRSDALHYSSDLVMNVGILIALILTKYFSLWWADAIFAIAISLWILKSALSILWSGITMLLDTSLSTHEISEIDTILRSEKALESYHYLKTRKSGDDIFIEAHIVFRDKNISLKKAHIISEGLESEISARFAGSVVTFHLDIDPEPEICSIHSAH